MGLKRGVLKKVAKIQKQTISYRRKKVFVFLPLFIKEKQGAKNPMTQHANQ
jgi:type III secretory pathway component EscS